MIIIMGHLILEFRICKKCKKITHSGTKCSLCGGSIDLKEPSFFIGKSFGKYKIEGILGQGDMGVVFLQDTPFWEDFQP